MATQLPQICLFNSRRHVSELRSITSLPWKTSARADKSPILKAFDINWKALGWLSHPTCVSQDVGSSATLGLLGACSTTVVIGLLCRSNQLQSQHPVVRGLGSDVLPLEIKKIWEHRARQENPGRPGGTLPEGLFLNNAPLTGGQYRSEGYEKIQVTPQNFTRMRSWTLCRNWPVWRGWSSMDLKHGLKHPGDTESSQSCASRWNSSRKWFWEGWGTVLPRMCQADSSTFFWLPISPHAPVALVANCTEPLMQTHGRMLRTLLLWLSLPFSGSPGWFASAPQSDSRCWYGTDTASLSVLPLGLATYLLSDFLLQGSWEGLYLGLSSFLQMIEGR